MLLQTVTVPPVWAEAEVAPAVSEPAGAGAADELELEVDRHAEDSMAVAPTAVMVMRVLPRINGSFALRW